MIFFLDLNGHIRTSIPPSTPYKLKGVYCFWFLLQHRLRHSTENKLFFSYLLFEIRDNLNLLFPKTVIIKMHTKKMFGVIHDKTN